MAALKKGVALSLGLITASVSIHGAIEPKAAGNKNVCCGPDAATHDPTLLRQTNRCAACDAAALAAGGTPDPAGVPYTQIKKAREVAGGLVLLEADEIVQAKGGADALKKATTTCAMTPHPAAEVEITMQSGEKMYWLTPDPGHEVQYALLRQMVSAHPELAFLAQWTPRSSAGLFRVITFQGCLALSERVRQARLKPAPVITAEAPAAMLAMSEQVLALPGVVTDYDPDSYADTYQERLAAIVASKQVIAAGGAAPAPAVASLPAGQQAAMDALAAMLGAATPVPVPAADPAPAPKRTRKKVST